MWPSQDTFDLLGPHNLVVSIMELLADNIPFLPSELREQLLAVTDMARHKRDVLQVSGFLFKKGQMSRKAEARKPDIPHLHFNLVVGAGGSDWPGRAQAWWRACNPCVYVCVGGGGGGGGSDTERMCASASPSLDLSGHIRKPTG